MKNALNYYYNLYPTSIHQVNNSYKCYVNNQEYLLIPYSGDIKIINKLYELNNYLYKINIPCHQIIQNNNGQILTIINNINYILLKIFVKNRTININDILLFSKAYIDSKQYFELIKDDWYQLWSKKIDYFEYQVSQFGIRYPVIRESINYYIGIAENSISLFINTESNKERQLVISHKRIKNNEGVTELYNPLNFVIDNRVRDLSEYIKEKFFYYKYTIDDAKNDIFKFNLTNYQYNLLFIRLLFPSYYFDCYEQVLLGNKNEDDLTKIISKNEQYLIFLRNLYFILKKFVNIPDIEWIIKT